MLKKQMCILLVPYWVCLALFFSSARKPALWLLGHGHQPSSHNYKKIVSITSDVFPECSFTKESCCVWQNRGRTSAVICLLTSFFMRMHLHKLNILKMMWIPSIICCRHNHWEMCHQTYNYSSVLPVQELSGSTATVKYFSSFSQLPEPHSKQLLCTRTTIATKPFQSA